MDLAEAKNLDFQAKDLERDSRHLESSQEKLQGLRSAKGLRQQAAGGFEEHELYMDAGYSWSRAARLAYETNDPEKAVTLRRNAIRCFSAAAEHSAEADMECAISLAFYGENLIRIGTNRNGNKRYFFIGLGINAIEEAAGRYDAYGIPPGRNIKNTALPLHARAKELLKSEGFQVVEKDGYSVITR